MRTTMILVTAAALFAAGCTKEPDEPATPAGGTSSTAPKMAGGGAAPAPKPALPSYWFESDFDKWIGKRWDEIDLFRFLPQAPSGIDTGTRYVVFYSRTCEHCEEMFRRDFARNPDLARKVTAVEVPADKTVLTSPDAWPMPKTEVEHLALPLGVNWIITTPLAVRVENGVIRCAEEGEHKGCLGLE